MRTHDIALIPGDGIGKEVVEAAMLVLRKAAEQGGFTLEETVYPWSCDSYLETGRMMPEDGIEQLRRHDSILLGAVGWPEKVPDSVSLHGLLLPIRKAFDLYVNMRPHRLLPGVTGPLRATDFDILCIRENTEGEYSGAGGRVHSGSPAEVAVETSIFTRRGVERILRYGFEQARARRGKLASVTKSNAQRHGMVFWDAVFEEVRKDYPDVETDKMLVDAMTTRMVLNPKSLDTIVATNLHADVLSDLAAALTGSLGIAPTGNLRPEKDFPSMFEPIHGSAFDIIGKGVANPIGCFWSGAMMLEHLGEKAAADRLMAAVARVTGSREAVSPDLGGDATTRQVTDAVLAAVRGAND